MSKVKKRTINIDVDDVKFVLPGSSDHGGYLFVEEWRDGMKIVVKIKIRFSWQIARIKKAMNKMIDHEMEIAEKFVDALNTNDQD